MTSSISFVVFLTVYIFLADHDAVVDFVRYKHRVLQAEGREAEYAILAVTEKPDAPKDNDTDIFLKCKIYFTLNYT